MADRPHNFPFDVNYNFAQVNVFQDFYFTSGNYMSIFPVPAGFFMYLNGTPFVLLNGGNLLLL